jgi:hypothetical protein
MVKLIDGLLFPRYLNTPLVPFAVLLMPVLLLGTPGNHCGIVTSVRDEGLREQVVTVSVLI